MNRFVLLVSPRRASSSLQKDPQNALARAKQAMDKVFDRRDVRDDVRLLQEESLGYLHDIRNPLNVAKTGFYVAVKSCLPKSDCEDPVYNRIQRVSDEITREPAFFLALAQLESELTNNQYPIDAKQRFEELRAKARIFFGELFYEIETILALFSLEKYQESIPSSISRMIYSGLKKAKALCLAASGSEQAQTLFEIAPILRSIVRDRPSLANVTIEVGYPARIFGSKIVLTRALDNLLRNAVEAVVDPELAKVKLRLSRSNGTYCIAVEDNGPGIPPEHIPDLLRPGFSTKSGTGGNRGFGLAIVADAVLKYLGELRVASQPGQGTTFLISLPVAVA